MITINMRSSASLIKGQGVGSCFEEQVRLVSEGLGDNFFVTVNSLKNSEIIHYHTINPGYYLERLWRKNRTVAIGYVHFLPDTLEDSLALPWLFKKILYRYLLSFYNSMDYLVTVNPYTIKKLERYGVHNPKVVYIPNYVSELDFHVISDAEIAATKRLYGIPEDKFIVMGAGQLQNRKGVLDFVKVAERMPHVEFIWAGGFSFGKISDGYDEIRALISNTPKNLRFLGIVDREKMVSLYNAADLVFLPSYDELFPMTVLEALCCKKPVLLRDIPVYRDILFDCYMKGSGVGDFCAAIDMMRCDKSVHNYWAEKAWECHMLYTKERILEMWDKLYTEACAESRRGIFLTEG